jgi:hypothetical protein
MWTYELIAVEKLALEVLNTAEEVVPGKLVEG